MKTYTLTLKGTKKNNTQDLVVELNGETKSQTFNFAYMFFEKADYDSNTAKYNWKVTDFIPNSHNLNELRGKYKVYRTSIKSN